MPPVITIPRHKLSFLSNLNRLAKEATESGLRTFDILKENMPQSDKFPELPLELSQNPDCKRLIKEEYELSKKKKKHKRKLTQNAKSEFVPTLKDGVYSFGANSGRLDELTSIVKKVFGVAAYCTGDFIYPPGGYRSWHTNAFDANGWRMYLVDVGTENASFFRYVCPKTNKIITIPDKKESVNFFYLGSEKLFWHCVGSESTYRVSMGFYLPVNPFSVLKRRMDLGVF